MPRDAASLPAAARPATRSRPIRTAILADMLEEQWPSMDLVADALMRELPGQVEACVEPRLVRPRLVPVLGRFRRGGVASPPRTGSSIASGSIRGRCGR